MPTTNTNRKILDLKRWDYCSTLPLAAQAGHQMAFLNCYKQYALVLASNSQAWLYNADDDAYVLLPAPGMAGGFGAGATAVGIPWSTGSTIGVASLTATGGTSSTLVTNQNLARDLRGYQIQILGGPAAGDIKTIASNTIGANATVTITGTFSASPTASTIYRLLTPRWLVVNAGALATGSVRIYDLATNTWTSVSQTGLPANIGTDSQMCITSSYKRTSFSSIATGTSTGTNTSTTLNNTGKAWTTNQWTNFQVRITSGTGAGQIRTIASNTGTSLTVSVAWTTTPDATSVYSIEGNDNFIYYVGSSANAIYRYSISANTWTALATRTGAPGTGVSLNWVGVSSDATWNTENAIITGRRIYSFRGGGDASPNFYDIAANTWTPITVPPNSEGFTTGSGYAQLDDVIYIQKENTGRWFKYNIVTNEIDGWNTMSYTQGTAVVGNRAWIQEYVDGGTTINFVVFWLNTLPAVLRMMII